MQPFSAWQPGIPLSFPTLSADEEADVAIVGGGLTGITCALMMTSLGLRVTLVEADHLGLGATLGCTGKVTAQQPENYSAVNASAGLDAARLFARLTQECVRDVKALITRLQLACSATDEAVCAYDHRSASQAPLQQLKRLEQRLELPVSVPTNAEQAAFTLPDQLLLSPLPYLAGLAQAAALQGCRIYEQSPALSVQEHRVDCKSGVVRAPWVVLATGSPMGCKKLSVLSLMRQRVIEARVLRTDVPFAGVWADPFPLGVNLRPVPGGVLITSDLGPVGASHTKARADVDAWQNRHFPRATEIQRLYRQDVWALDGLPLIGPIDMARPQLLMASGYSGWGMTGSFLAARLLTAHVMNRPLDEGALFLPHRVYPLHTLQVARGSVGPMVKMVGGWLRPSAPVCPHMGCKLQYSKETDRWECPCHGSCFNDRGQLFHTPATRDTAVPPPKRS